MLSTSITAMMSMMQPAPTPAPVPVPPPAPALMATQQFQHEDGKDNFLNNGSWLYNRSGFCETERGKSHTLG